VSHVSEERLGRLIEELASFETRHTLSSVTDPHLGIVALAGDR
jgi:hypothetical protein